MYTRSVQIVAAGGTAQVAAVAGVIVTVLLQGVGRIRPGVPVPVRPGLPSAAHGHRRAPGEGRRARVPGCL
ncbi:hypothetical protein WN71_032375 [Streptomyces mangrovisoli]|uniref:Uncharacterized protein n=1 Tax=Streptomyces mangrovisoli TaxID=1428628 RepID=A0A1J4NR72_9ACTN|nr:hypothetical protein WN71_032375 [Streptomyces mangrovisoli]